MLLRLAQAIQQDVSSTYARSQGLSVAEWRMLARLNADSPMQLADLCRGLAMDKPYASRILRVLGPRGLVTVRKDPTHGRRVIVEITAQGRALARTLLPAMHASQQQLLQVLDPGERAVLYGAIKKLQAAIPHCRAQAAALAGQADSRRTP